MARDIDPDYCDYILCWIHHLYIRLHQGTNVAPTAFNAATSNWDFILSLPLSYPLCGIASHHQNSTVLHPTQPIPGSSTTPQHAHVISELPSSEQEFSSPSSSNSVHIPLQAAVPSIHEFVQMFAPDLNRLVSNLLILVSLFSAQTSLSTANLNTNIGQHNELTPDMPINEVRETSQTPIMTLLTDTFPQHDPELVPIIVNPPIVVHLPSISVEQQGEFSNPPQPIPSDLTLLHHLDAHEQQDTTASRAGSDITLVSSNATQIHDSIPIVMLPPTSSGIPMEHPPSVELAVVQPNHLLGPLGSPSSTPMTTKPYMVPSILDTTSNGNFISCKHDENCDPKPPTPTEASLHAQQSGSAPEA